MSHKHLAKAAFFLGFIIIGATTLNAQDNDSLLQKRIMFKQYVFVPLSFSSPSFSSPLNSSEYKLEVATDSIIAVLPFFGKSNTPQHGRSDDDFLRFVSGDYEYTAVPKKKGKWEITIIPKETRGIRIFLTVYSNGEAQMDLTSPRKETMYFKGYVW